MLTITSDALAIIQEQNRPIFLDMPKLIRNCCFELQECPSIRFGEPRDIENYERRVIGDTTVFVPNRMPQISLTIAVSSFLGFKRLVVEGWCFF